LLPRRLLATIKWWQSASDGLCNAVIPTSNFAIQLDANQQPVYPAAARAATWRRGRATEGAEGAPPARKR